MDFMYRDELILEFEKAFKKLNINFAIFIYKKIIEEFPRELQSCVGSQNLTHEENVLRILEDDIKGLNSLEDVQKLSVNILVDLDYSLPNKLGYMKELSTLPILDVIHRILSLIKQDRRFADFCLSQLNPLFQIDQKEIKEIQFLKIEEARKEHPYSYNILTAKRKPVFLPSEAVLAYEQNSQLLANLWVVKTFYANDSFGARFEKLLRQYQSAQELSKTIITKKLAIEGFSEWLYMYVQKWVSSHDGSWGKLRYTAISVEERKNLVLHQLDYWYIRDEVAYKQLLKKIEAAWHKRTFDARKREDKLKKPIRKKSSSIQGKLKIRH